VGDKEDAGDGAALLTTIELSSTSRKSRLAALRHAYLTDDLIPKHPSGFEIGQSFRS
jgi:hypothetical protein